MRNILSGRLAMLGAACALVACSKGTEPPTPTTINVSPSGTVSFTSINQTQLLTATVLDQHGATMAGLKVTWATNNALVATVDTLGVVKAKANGTATVTASSGGASKPVSVTVAQAAATITKIAGDEQVGSASSALGAPLIAQVLDANGNAAVGVTVSFAAAAGNGTLFPTSAVTNASGSASTAWTLGVSARETASVSAGSAAPVTFTAAALSSASAAGFQISVVNVGPPLDPAAQAAFDSAAAFWSRAITGDIPDYPSFSANAGDCGAGWPAVGPINIDDVVILARLDSIDGPGKILGSAGPCYVRVSGTAAPFTLSFPLLGTMRFDTADVRALINSGQLNAVIKHEMAHVLGFGTYWPASINSQLNGFGCLQLPSSAGSSVDTYYNCARGLVVFDSIGGTSYTGVNKVPVENCVGITGCGAGTYNAHWRESTFFNELMTGYINTSVANPVSALTLAQMQDLGYTVNLGAAEAYSRTFTSPPAAMAAGAISGGVNLGDDVTHGPIYAVDRRGRIVAVIRPQ